MNSTVLTTKWGISSSFSSWVTPRIARALGLWSTTMRFTLRAIISRLRPLPRPTCIEPGSRGIFPLPRPRPAGGRIRPNRVAWRRTDREVWCYKTADWLNKWAPPGCVKKIIMNRCGKQMWLDASMMISNHNLCSKLQQRESITHSPHPWSVSTLCMFVWSPSPSLSALCH